MLLFGVPGLLAALNKHAIVSDSVSALTMVYIYIVWEAPWVPFHSIWVRHLEWSHAEIGSTEIVVLNLAFYALLIWCALQIIHRIRERSSHSAAR